MTQEDTRYREYLQSTKWRGIAQERLKIDGYKCQMCGSRGTATNPLEVHHLSYKHLYHEEERIYEDLITLCSLDHRSIHKAMERITNADGRQGWKSNPRIPTVHAFNINGYVERKEMKNNE